MAGTMSQAQAAPQLHTEPCPKCRGSGRYLGYSTIGSSCFKCGGTGRLTFKNPPEVRAANRAAAADAKVRKATGKAEAWAAANPAEWAWIAANNNSSRFAASLEDGLMKFGSLTPGQAGAIRRIIEGEAKPRPAAVAVTMPEVEACFDKAKARGIKYPKLRLDAFTFKPAGGSSKNAGAIYVTQGRGEEGQYLGKVMGGKFMRSRDCNDELAQRIVAAAQDPKSAAIAYGKQFGKCSICNRDLTDPESIALGIGPVCADNMGW